MKTITSILRHLSFSGNEPARNILSNPSEVLKVHREDVSGTLEIKNLNSSNESPLRISWIKRDDVISNMKPVWVNEEMMVL